MSNNRNRYASDNDPGWAHLSPNATGTPTYRERIEEQQRIRAKNNTKDRFVALRYDMTGSPAWKALGRGGRDAYSWIERRYRKTNNGKIPMGVRELAEQMGVHKDTANRYLRCCEALGFIKPAKRGHFGDKSGARRTTRWRLTEYPTDGEPPTRDYLNFGLVEANQRVREASERDPKRLHPGRKRKSVRPQNTDGASEKCGRVRPQNTDKTPVSVHGNWHFASAKYGQSTAVPGEEPSEPRADNSESVCAPPASGRKPARGKSTRQQQEHLSAAPHVKRSATAKNCEVRAAVKKLMRERKKTARELKEKFS